MTTWAIVAQMKALGILLVTVALVASSFASAAPPTPPKRTKTVVVGIQGRRGVDPDLARALSDVVQSVLTQDASRVVLGRADIEQVVKLEAEKQAMGCTDSSCLSEVATAMDADRIVTGTMDKVGASFLIVVTEIDARALEPLSRVEVTVPADETKLIDAVRAAARDLVAKSPKAGQGGPGSLVVTSSPAGAQVFVDGQLVGTTPARTGDLPAGDKKITLRPTGAPPIDLTAPVAPGGPTIVDVKVATGPSPEAQQELQSKRTWNNIWGATKLGVGGLCMLTGATCLCFSCVSAVPTATEPSEPGAAALWAVLGAVTGLPGVGLGIWGALDFMNPPELPDDAAMNEVLITPPAGEARRVEVPFAAGEMAH